MFETRAQMVIIFQGKMRSQGALGIQSGGNLLGIWIGPPYENGAIWPKMGRRALQTEVKL